MVDQNELEAAIEEARNAPENEELWDELEGIAGELDRPDEAAALYREVLQLDLDKETLLSLGERAAQFHEDWYSEDTSGLESVLKRVLEIEPNSASAFQRLTVVYTVSERWDELLAVYNHAIDAADDEARRIRLLDEAAQVSKDVANRPDDAIAYLQRLLPLRPDDSKIAHNLGRLLERHERWRELIALWETNLDDLPKAEREETRARIAACWMDNLNDPAQALAATRPLLAEASDDTEACALLERILASEHSNGEVREGALDLLRSHYEGTQRPREVVRVLGAAIDRAAPEEDRSQIESLHEEAGELLADLGDDDAAMEHYSALLALNPASAVTQELMRQIATRSGNFGAYARGIGAAAEACEDISRKVELLGEAARTRLDLDDEAGAIEMYQRALAQEGLSEKDIRTVARRLSELLASADRHAEQLDVLEKLATVETSVTRRKAVYGEAARLAEALGEPDRALAAWRTRVEGDPDDTYALDAMISLLENERRWEPLIEALNQRVSKATTVRAKHHDLTRIATIYQEELENEEEAIAAWVRVQQTCGDDAENIDALAALYSQAGRWADLAELFERVSGPETARVLDRLVRFADAQRDHLGAPEKALDAYERAIAIDNHHEQARAGLTGLLEDPAFRGRAANALADAYRRTAEWQRYLELLEPRLADTDDAHARLVILKEAAEIQEQQFNDYAAALQSLAQAFPLAPKERGLGQSVMRLADLTGNWELAASTFDLAAQAATDEPFEVAHLRFELANMFESKLDKSEEAHGAYFAVAGIEPDNLAAVRGVVRLGSRLGRWDEVSATVVACCRARKTIEDDLFSEMEAVAGESGAFDSLATAMAAAVEQSSDLLPRVAFDLYRRIAVWHRDRRDDKEAAEAFFKTALSFDNDQPETLRELAALQRENPGPGLYDTLRTLVDADSKDLDALHEAANVAFEHLDDSETTRSALTALLARASAAWRGTAEAHGSETPETYVVWATNKLVDHYVETGKSSTAVDLLVDTSRLPFDDETKRAMRYRAAAIAAEAGDRSGAIEMYRSVLAQAPDDSETADKLAELYEAENRYAEMLTLRQSEMARVADGDERKLDLRLEVSRLVGEVERIGGRLDALRANLAEVPGHAASIEALCSYLGDKGQHELLADILEDQANKLEELEKLEGAADLWARAAEVAEVQLRDLDRAIADHRRVVAAVPEKASPDTLARLYMEREQPGLAVPWFEKHLESVEGEERESVVLLLANAHLGAERPEQAIACLEANLSDESASMPLRSLLLDLYRKAESWAPLARLLTKSLPLLENDDTAIAFAREAAGLYIDRLEQPDKAIPALEKARELAPGDRGILQQLAVGLRVAGRHEEARAILDGLIEEFGRRRSAERAAVHVEIAMVAKAQGNREEALEQLKLGSKMDVGNPRIQRMVAELSLESGELDEAERTYRALLLVVRRQPPGEDESAVGVSEILYELHRIATTRGEEEQATELLESTLEAAVQSDAEVRRLRRSLLAHDEPEILLRALRMRLDASKEKRSQARLLTDIADVLDRSLERSADALDAQLKAVELIPDNIAHHDRARVLAQNAGQVDRYVDCVKTTVERLRRKKDAPLVASLLMKAGNALEEDAGDLAQALEVYKRVEATGNATAEACFAIARVAGALGNEEEKSRALDILLELALAEEPSPHQVDALYRLAEIFVESDERRTQGVELLRQAFAAEPRYKVAGATLKKAAEADAENTDVLGLYEKVARGSGDWEMQLDFLERRARLPGATPAQVKEAVDLAAEHGQQERGEALLSKAVEAARATEEGIAAAIWAVVALAEQQCATGDLPAARNLFFELADVADPDRTAELGLTIATKAAETDDSKELAAEIYEFLHSREPAARHVWEPLIALYRELGAADRLQNTISATLPTLVEPAERNALRMQHAKHLIESVEDPDRATEVLRDILLEDPDHLEAAALLEKVLRDSGNQEGLADFLWQRFEEAKERRNPETIADVAKRLGALLDEMESPEAATVYRAALEIAPENRDLLAEVLAHLDAEADPRERAQIMERLLAVESEENAPELATDLYALYGSMEDTAGMQRALELGHRANPYEPTLRQRLETWYRENELWQPLAEMMAAEAERLEDASLAVERLRESASVYKDMLGDLSSAAALLRRAWDARPTDENLVSELVGCLVMASDRPAAVEVLGETLENDLEAVPRVNLLMQRADLRLDLDQGALAVQDLEEAYLLDPERVGPQLIVGLERHRARAQEQDDRDAERAATLRLAELLTEAGSAEQARELMTLWVEREPGDRDALYFLRDMDTASERWDGVLMACSRLVVVEEGAEQIDAALRLAEAAEKAEQPDAARQGLEQVHAAQPDSSQIRDQLRRIYELSGAHRELAMLLLADAQHAEDADVAVAAYQRAAELFLALGDPGAAAEPAQKVCELKPDTHEATTLYADVLTMAGRTDEAIALLEPAIAAHRRRSPELASLQQRMARIMAAAGDGDGHMTWLKKAFDVDRKNGEIASELAQLSTEIGDYDLALKALRAITLMDNPGPITRVMALLWEAKIEYARGNNAKAELWAKKALREDPNYAEAQEFLDQITS